MSDESKFEEAKKFVSGLGTGREAFHSEITEYCLKIGERTPEDFIRLFSPVHIMQALAGRPMERARIIAEATGVHDRVAHKMSPENSGEALQIALEEKVTTPADVVRLFQPDDRQRYLDRKALWKFDVEGEPWKVSPSVKPAFDRAKAYLSFILERAIANLLVSHEELIEALTVARLAEHLPREQLGAIITASLRREDKFTEVHLLEVVPPSTLVKHVPLDYVWDKAVVPLIAERHEYAPKGAASEPKRDDKKADVSKPASGKATFPKGPFGLGKAKSEEPSWSVAPAKEEEDGDLVGEDEIMEDAPPSTPGEELAAKN